MKEHNIDNSELLKKLKTDKEKYNMDENSPLLGA
jgi:hypothetical protein